MNQTTARRDFVLVWLWPVPLVWLRARGAIAISRVVLFAILDELHLLPFSQTCDTLARLPRMQDAHNEVNLFSREASRHIDWQY